MALSATDRSALAPPRDVTVDRFKVLLTIAVILTHVAITYGAGGDWFYREQTRQGVVQHVLDVPIVLGAFCAMGAFFFVAGCFVPASLARKGPARYARDRLLRLGVPALAFVLVVVPGIERLVAAVAGPDETTGQVLRDQLRTLDTGPLWFATALLLFLLVVAGARAAGFVLPADRSGLTLRRLAVTACVIVAASFLLRTRFALDTYQVGSLHVWQWGQCAGLFVLGVRCGRSGLGRPSATVLRRCRYGILGGLAAVVLVLSTAHHLTPFGGGWHWQSAVVCLIEGVVSVSGTVLLLDACRRRPTAASRSRRLGPLAFGAYVLQAPVIVAISLACRPLELPVVAKLLIVGALSVLCCFGISGAVARAARGAAAAVIPSG